MGMRRLLSAVAVTLAAIAVTLTVALGASAHPAASAHPVARRAAPATVGGLPLLSLTQVLSGHLPRAFTLALPRASAQLRSSRAPVLRIPEIVDGGHACPVDAGDGSPCDVRTCTEFISISRSCGSTNNGLIGPQVIPTPRDSHASGPGLLKRHLLTPTLPKSLLRTLRARASKTG